MNRLSPKTVSLHSINLIKAHIGMNDETIKDEAMLRPFTMEEIDAILDKAEANFAAGLGIPGEVVFSQLEEEFVKEDQKSQLESI